MNARLSCFGLGAAFLVVAGDSLAQTEKSPNEGLCALPGRTPGVTDVRWWGKAGRTYFLQTNPTLHPASWTYLPVVESGANVVLSYSMGGVERRFARLVYTDQPDGGNAATADFDGDGISNAAEVAVGGPGSDPLVGDSDWDGYHDGVEVLAGTGVHNGQSNPGTDPPASGELNPDGHYRHGLRLDIAAKYMMVNDYTSTFQTPTYYECYAIASHVAGSTQTIFPSQYSTTGTLLADCKQAFDQAGFQSPIQKLFQPGGAVYLRGTRSDYLSMGTGTDEGKSSERYFRERGEMQVQAQASPAAPSWARRSLALLYLRDWSTTDVESAGWVMLSKYNVRASPSALKHCNIQGAKVVISPWLTTDLPDQNASARITSLYLNRYLQLFDAEIEPADGMIGVVGDMVRSKSDASHVRHFVTPKLTTEIPATHVELKCGVSVTDFDKYFEWEGGTAGSATNLRKVSRSTAARTEVKIKNKQTGTVVAEMHVWVVWCDPPTVTAGTANFVQVDERIVDPLTGQPTGFTRNVESGYRSSANRRFKYTIKPAEICNLGETDRPDLEGAKRSNPPGFMNPYVLYSAQQADTATNKWDISRKMKVTIRNPYGILRSKLEEKYPATLCLNQPTRAGQNPPDDIPVDYPADPVEGNDDPILSEGPDEDTNPYVALSSGDLSHGNGELTSVDAPNLYVRRSWGTLGEHLALELNFKEFCRLEITDGTRSTGTRWFRISDYHDWHFYLHTDFDDTNDQWENGSPPSATGAGHPLP